MVFPFLKTRTHQLEHLCPCLSQERGCRTVRLMSVFSPAGLGQWIRNVSGLQHCCYCSELAGREERMSARVSRNKIGNLSVLICRVAGDYATLSRAQGMPLGRQRAGMLQDIQGPGTRSTSLDHQLAAQQPAHMLPCKHKDQSSISRTHTKKLGAVGCPCNPNNSKMEGGERERSLKTCRPLSLAFWWTKGSQTAERFLSTTPEVVCWPPHMPWTLAHHTHK